MPNAAPPARTMRPGQGAPAHETQALPLQRGAALAPGSADPACLRTLPSSHQPTRGSPLARRPSTASRQARARRAPRPPHLRPAPLPRIAVPGNMPPPESTACNQLPADAKRTPCPDANTTAASTRSEPSGPDLPPRPSTDAAWPAAASPRAVPRTGARNRPAGTKSAEMVRNRSTCPHASPPAPATASAPTSADLRLEARRAGSPGSVATAPNPAAQRADPSTYGAERCAEKSPPNAFHLAFFLSSLMIAPMVSLRMLRRMKHRSRLHVRFGISFTSQRCWTNIS